MSNSNSTYLGVPSQTAGRAPPVQSSQQARNGTTTAYDGTSSTTLRSTRAPTPKPQQRPQLLPPSSPTGTAPPAGSGIDGNTSQQAMTTTSYGTQQNGQGAPDETSLMHPPPSVMDSWRENKRPLTQQQQTVNPSIHTARVPSTPGFSEHTDDEVTSTSASGTGTTDGTQEEALNIMEFIKDHLCRGKREFPYNHQQLFQLTKLAIESFQKQPTLIETDGPINVCGDIHGQYSDLLRIFHAVGPPQNERYLFLGDYVDRGPKSMEVIALLLACKVQWPDHIFLLRGNHELSHINKIYGFWHEIARRIPDYSEQIFDRFNRVFSYMPLAATIGGRILCMHGGISPRLHSLDDIRRLERPIPIVIEPGLVQDLLWADPCPDVQLRGFQSNDLRNCSHVFGEEALTTKLKLLNIDMIIRAHQVATYGYSKYANGKLITVFSAPHYNPDPGHINWGAVAKIDKNLEIRFVLIKPKGADNNSGQRGQAAGSKIQRSC